MQFLFNYFFYQCKVYKVPTSQWNVYQRCHLILVLLPLWNVLEDSLVLLHLSSSPPLSLSHHPSILLFPLLSPSFPLSPSLPLSLPFPLEQVISHPDEMENLEQYRVIGDYRRTDNHQVDLTAGQLVHVIEKHDTGNPHIIHDTCTCLINNDWYNTVLNMCCNYYYVIQLLEASFD